MPQREAEEPDAQVFYTLAWLSACRALQPRVSYAQEQQQQLPRVQAQVQHAAGHRAWEPPSFVLLLRSCFAVLPILPLQQS